MESAITSKGQATIPKPVRDYLGLKAGDRVKFYLQPDGTVALLPKLPITALRGMVPARKRPVSMRRLRQAPAEGAVSREARSRGGR